jgi:hypothetical protein
VLQRHCLGACGFRGLISGAGAKNPEHFFATDVPEAFFSKKQQQKNY